MPSARPTWASSVGYVGEQRGQCGRAAWAVWATWVARSTWASGVGYVGSVGSAGEPQPESGRVMRQVPPAAVVSGV
ncbi:hypothetical protein HMPREF1980_00563 [Actinomyces sp. oral taxon 172 str. F0311]|nr:hypothetical protein HMPREF1980_00563 [Actinomyces sp. oral taxon 172 str. F0311]